VRPGDIVIDPFCGVGGTLLEVLEVGGTGVGLDFKQTMVKGAMSNLSYFGHTKWYIIMGDARNAPLLLSIRLKH